MTITEYVRDPSEDCMQLRRRGDSRPPAVGSRDDRAPGQGVRGRRIVIDPGHGGPDPGVTIAGVAEADLVWDLARRLEGRMAGAGMHVLLSRREHTCPTEVERAALANTAGADLVLSLHVDGNRSMHAEGLAAFHHFDDGPGAAGAVGEDLAGYVCRELVSRTGMLDLGTRAGAWDLLRLTRMPAVRVEIGYLSNLGDRRRLLDPVFRDVVAEGLLVGVTRFCLQGEDDAPTGTFTFSDVLAHELGRNGPSRAQEAASRRHHGVTPP